jgi:vacuolar-type H+-ATPase catalytic subunit A/Vma1
MKNIVTIFERYSPELSELIVKNMMSSNVDNVKLWETINDLIAELKRLNQTDIVANLEKDLLDSSDELKTAISASLKATTHSENFYRIIDKLKQMKKDKTVVCKVTYKVKNSIQANIVKELVEKAPYRCAVTIKAVYIEVNCKNNTEEEINLLLKELPFEAFKVS